jgi:PAS domain S-box-containing protein
MNRYKKLDNLISALDKNVIINETDEKGIITFVSEAFCKISGYSEEELIGQPHNICKDDSMSKDIFKDLWKTIKANKTWTGEIRNKRKDGSYYWLYNIITPICQDKDVFCGYTAIRYDISDKKEVEKELDEQKEYLEIFFENKGVGILIVDKDRTNIRANNKLCEMWGYSKSEVLGQNVSILHKSQESYIKFGNMGFDKVIQGKYVNIEYQFKKKNGDLFWARFYGEFISNNQVLWVIEDITKQREVQLKLESEKKLIDSIINSQDAIVIASDGAHMITINQAFKDFYEVNSIKEYEDKYGLCICDSYEENLNQEYLTKYMNGVYWVDYVLNNSEKTTKVAIKKDGKLHIFTISLDKFVFDKQKFVTVVFNDITDLEATKQEIESIHKHTRESIEYAALIQGSILPENKLLEHYFKGHFVTWTPKDTVGGDIWLFEKLRHEDECLLFFIDCTGHGVPGAFVTMIVKAVEREIVAKIKASTEDVSPSFIMEYFNKTMKTLLRQDNEDSLSNAGWDGGIIYYNKRTQILKFAGAETPLFYTMPDGEFKTIKGNRYSVGYKKCDMDYKYKETVIDVQEGMKFFCTTDGYLDQNGGEKGFPFGKKRFGNIIKENYQESMADLQAVFQWKMMEWESMVEDNDRNDDMTLIGFEIDKKSDYVEEINIEIVKYEGVITQNVISAMVENVEANIDNMSTMGTLATITIEYCQNMMNYSKNEEEGSCLIVPAGSIDVNFIDNNYYEIVAVNIISKDDKEKIEPKLIEIQSLDKQGIKKRYRELRKSGQNTHAKGGGIGMYEIAKVSDKIEYKFTPINEDKYYFTMKSIIFIKKNGK